ncbi:hypothetical protein GDO86_007381 [Hymenochirus boettgeri]|uniref:Shisa N-terminal domain-containing protein n=1 Tax=Hymenochirus boettgeri TaxID=247094 RepID=A0A8T2J1K9_9PIPI|nr:hypothetical protein GDO86_007381 [Hymenochirus boettgeri]
MSLPILLLGAASLLSAPAVMATDCAAFFGSDFRFHEAQVCILSTCSGTCGNRYCNIIPGGELDQSQFLCIVTNYWVVIGAIIITAILIIAGVITCVVKSCCCLFSICDRRHQVPVVTRETRVLVTNVTPQQTRIPVVGSMSLRTAGYQPLLNPPAYSQTNELAPRSTGENKLVFLDSP